MGAQELVDHLKNCRNAGAVIAGDGDLTDVVDTMLKAGWTADGVEYVEGKRVRYLVPPKPAITCGFSPNPLYHCQDPAATHVVADTPSGVVDMFSCSDETHLTVARRVGVTLEEHPATDACDGAHCRKGHGPSSE